ncbi:GH36-type glycosyl hydrolase domain-containing protein [[Clostridium] fimetarium]|uniref:Cellobiose phosphorylase n=1 Tax=[Clostridium] fimetarium TaxID=99656 RepID=A0A1I0QIJ1_9FIRM|nr:glucoamylase family protein [[Clostridium] fimetarium]SEW26826.1 Cellobiose phosphorylase [[Clostridium] fimetarium]
MSVYDKVFIEGIVLIVLAVICLLLILLKLKSNSKINVHDASLSSEELEYHAKSIAMGHSVFGNKKKSSWPMTRMNSNYNFILTVYKELNEDIQKKYAVPSAAEWLLDNFYVIEEQVKGLRRDLNRKSYSQLPALQSGPLVGYARIFDVVLELVAHTNGQMDEKILSDYLKAYQSHSVLFDREIQALPLVIRLAIIENIRNVCENIKQTQNQWHKADENFETWSSNDSIDTNKAIKLFKNSLKSVDLENRSFVEHLVYRLRKSGRIYAEVLKTMDIQLAKLGISTENIAQEEHSAQSDITISMSNSITSLHYFSTLDWEDMFEDLSFVDQILKGDPDGTYQSMDYFTRMNYIGKAEELAHKYRMSEIHIARVAIKLAKGAYENRADSLESQEISREWHVGYYLLGPGREKLKKMLEPINKFKPERDNIFKKYSTWLYLGSISLLTILLVYFAIEYSILSDGFHSLPIVILAGFCVLIPASEIAVNAVNLIVCKCLKPAIFPRMELKDGIPENLSTIVVVPTLLPDVVRVKEMLAILEGHYLSNREDNLFFTLVGAFADSKVSVIENDTKIIEAAMSGIEELNIKYSKTGTDKFYFFHRASQFNKSNNKWIGWERKRGALMEFNELVLGSLDTSFIYSSCKNPPFSNVKYIITLDSDTILPMGMAKKMIGTMSHPLNRPIVDSKKGIVTEGYGIMQPRVDVDVESSNSSIFSRIFTGQEGIDPYANAISDVYQDLFGEGIYTGKGIYDLHVFQEVMTNIVPDNSVLSHDLLEGSYMKTGLVGDLKLIDSFPSRYNSYSERMHRWARGDWQLFPLLFGKLSNRIKKMSTNPLTLLSRWKIFDNLRRSLVAPTLFIMLALGFCVLPGSMYFWIGIFVVSLAFPFIIEAIGYIFAGELGNVSSKHYVPVIAGVKAALLQALLTLTFSPFEAWLMCKSIIVTLYRVIITKKNLLEWQTSDNVEKTNKNSLKSYIWMMKVSIIVSPLILFVAIVFKPEAIPIGLFLFVLWASSPFIAYWISKDIKEKPDNISQTDMYELGKIARKTWRYFEEFSNSGNHYLAPDNYQVDPPKGIAARTSPTNIGLGLLATLTARDLGYIGSCEMTDLIEKTVSTIERLEKWNGHLYNWYDTRTLIPLKPRYISTVDSGNLISYLITLREGMKEILGKPIVDSCYFNGIRDTLYCAGNEDDAKIIFDCQNHVNVTTWNQLLDDLMNEEELVNIKNDVWKSKFESMLLKLKKEVTKWMPWLDLMEKVPMEFKRSEYENYLEVNKLIDILLQNRSIKDLPFDCTQALSLSNELIAKIQVSEGYNGNGALDWLKQISRLLIRTTEASEQFIKNYLELIGRIDNLSDNTVFLPLYVEKKHLFSIGYNIEENKLTNSYYDLLASEARQVSYITIARGEIPASHWFKLGRSLTVVDSYKGLVSWTGTMFEYLMPLLIMKTYKNTLLDETYSFVIKCQKKYGKERNMPWGTSESQYNMLDLKNNYQYKAIGVPSIALKRGMIEDAVAAPYATFLALLVDPQGAISNIKHLKAEGIEGPYGFFEAADYTPARLRHENKRTIVKSYMAHHQGLSLISLNNFINKNIMQKRFHLDPAMNAARLLLKEKVPSDIVFVKTNKEKVPQFKEVIFNEQSTIRSFDSPNPVLPKAHILTNGNYSVMITDRGTGYSKNKMAEITRWREDSTLDSFGTFFYLRNVSTDYIWSATYAPLNVLPDKYEVIFQPEKITFKRQDREIETMTEVVVASGDDSEIRRISLKNNGKKTCEIELTSYFEVVLAPQAADIAQPIFSNLFIETEFNQEKGCIIAKRRTRAETEEGFWIANSVIQEGGIVKNIQFVTDRMQMIGRGNTAKHPISIGRNRPLMNSVGPVLDPVMCMRVKVKVEPGKTVKLSFVSVVAESNETLMLLVDKYASADAIEGAFRLALTRSQIETKYLNMSITEIELYQNLISHILFISPMKKIYEDFILKNSKGQSSLWKYSISGDIPIVLVVLKSSNKVKILYQVLKAHEYWRSIDLKVDLVILNEEENSYSSPLQSLISDIVLSSQTHNIIENPEDIYMLEKNKMQPEDVNLLYAVARIVLVGDEDTIEAQVDKKNVMMLPGVKEFNGQEAEFEKTVLEEQELIYFNGLGGFNLDGDEYIIKLEGEHHTPAPWVNVIANPEFGFVVSESGSGYTWNQNSRENKLTPCSYDVVSDGPGEALYISDDETGNNWTATALPIRESEPYTIKHGFGYSIFEHISHGIEQRLTQFVPVNDPIKITIANLTNKSKIARNLTLTYYVRPILGVSDQGTAMHIKTSIGESGAFLIENPYNEDFGGRICFVDSSITKRSVTGNRKEFFGNGDMSEPECLARKGLSGETGIGMDPCCAIQVKITLEPGESRDIIFLLGMTSDIFKANELIQRYTKAEKATEALIEVKQNWKDKMNVLQFKTPDCSMDIMLNGWLLYQILSCRLWARSGFYQAGGAFGFRDQLQDCLSIAGIWPEIAREQILLHAKHQFTQGDVQHWWHAPQEKGIRTRCSDDLLWLPYVTAEYIRLTGDEDILEEQVTFLEEAPLMENESERYGKSNVSLDTASLYEHCLRAVDASLKFGKHGLPLMGTGDWNDGMNTVGDKGFGESVWLGWFLVSVLKIIAPICTKMGDTERAEKYNEIRNKVTQAIENAWDGNWYRRAYFDNGQILGSEKNIECKIDSIAQTWSVISGEGEPRRSMQAMNSLEEYLINREEGIIKLLSPPFDKGDLEPGYIKGYVPGVRENGGQYTHAAAWTVIAFAKLGDGDKAGELFELINPISHANDLREYFQYKVEPYVMSADVYAVHPHMGRGGWSWYTGSAGWMYQAGSEYILGFQRNGDSVIVDPCIPSKWNEYSMKYQFHTATYEIKVSNPEGVCRGVKKITIDGKTLEGNGFDLINDGRDHVVEVLMG